MHFYEKELKALKRAGRYRSRVVQTDSLIDLASNDYLGFAHNKTLLEKAYKRLLSYTYHSPKASMLVNGYHHLHQEFESYISKLTSFEDTLVVGSGFLANLSIFEALVRKSDLLILDSEFHASGILASKLLKNILFFKHNNPKDLEQLLSKNKANRVIVAVEGVYSMEGDILNPEIFDICDKYNTLLVIDEAHSMGVLGDRLLGIYDHFKIKPKPNHIKMATLGKAMGSYGAYISASAHIIEYLLNRAKPIIYSTAPSVFDISLAYEGYKEIEQNYKIYTKKRDQILDIVKNIFDINQKSLILRIDIGDNNKVLQIQKKSKDMGFLVGAIREPTVKSPILRVVLRVAIDKRKISSYLSYLHKQNLQR